MERPVHRGRVQAVGPVNRRQHQGAILDGAGDWADLVHAPRQRHAAGPRTRLRNTDHADTPPKNEPEYGAGPVGCPVFGFEHAHRMIRHRRKMRHQKPAAENIRESEHDDE